MPLILARNVEDLECLSHAVTGATDEVGAALNGVAVTGAVGIKLCGVECETVSLLVAREELAELGACVAVDVVAVARWCRLVRGCSTGQGRCDCGCRGRSGAGCHRNAWRLSGDPSCRSGRDCRCRLGEKVYQRKFK